MDRLIMNYLLILETGKRIKKIEISEMELQGKWVIEKNFNNLIAESNFEDFN